MSRPHPLTTITIDIDVPAANANVPGDGSFDTYGYSVPKHGVAYQAQVVDGSNTYTGTAITPIAHDPSYQWGFSFTGVPVGDKVSLTVTGSDLLEDTGSDTIEITCTNP